MAREKLHASTATPYDDSSNVVPIRPGIVPTAAAKRFPAQRRRLRTGLQTPSTLSPALQSTATSETGKNPNDDGSLPLAMSAIHVRENDSLSLSPANANPPSHSLTVFRRQIEKLTKMQLRERFVQEAGNHRSIVGRCNRGEGVLHPDFKDFARFLWHLGPQPAPGWSVDRTDCKDPIYGPGKCEWSSPRQQANNRSTTVHLKAGGEVRPLTHWAQLTGQDPKTIAKRLDRGWTHEEAVSGKRGGHVEAEPVPAPPVGDAAKWPPMDAAFIPAWEGAYRLYVAHYEAVWRSVPKGVTRAMFLGWMAANLVDAFTRALVKDHPGYLDPETHPEDFEGWDAVEADPRYGQRQRFERLVKASHAAISGNPEEWEQLDLHRRKWRRIGPASPELTQIHAQLAERTRERHRLEVRADRIRQRMEEEDHRHYDDAEDDCSTPQEAQTGPVAPALKTWMD